MHSVNSFFSLEKCFVSEDGGDATGIFSAKVYGDETISKAMA